MRNYIILKFSMALSGLAMVGFLVGHVSGNLLIFLGPEAINSYAKNLHKYEELLWVARIGLIISIFVHFVSGVYLTIMNRRARKVKYAVHNPTRSTLASRTMMISGSVVLSFIALHLAHLTFRATDARLLALGPYDVYEMLILSFQTSYLAFFYIFSVILLGFHLNHGVQSVFQTLGISHSSYRVWILWGSRGLSGLLSFGFLSIPLAVWLGFLV